MRWLELFVIIVVGMILTEIGKIGEGDSRGHYLHGTCSTDNDWRLIISPANRQLLLLRRFACSAATCSLDFSR